MTPGARAIAEYLTELLVKDALEREAEVDPPAAGQQNAPGEEAKEASGLEQ